MWFSVHEVLCEEQMPFITYGRNCLEVKDCFALNASAWGVAAEPLPRSSRGLDARDRALSFWLTIEADDEQVGVS